MAVSRKILLFFVVIASVAAAVLALLPWKAWVGAKIIHSLGEQGIAPVELEVGAIGLEGVEITGVRIGEPPLTLERVTVGYQLATLLKGKIGTVTLQGLTLAATESENGWVIEGAEALTSSAKAEESASPAIPLTQAALDPIPVETIEVKDSTVRIAARQWQLEGPVALRFSKAEGALHLSSAGLTLSKGADSLTMGLLKVDLALDPKAARWQGKWTLENLALHSESLALPALAGEGELELDAKGATLEGKLSDVSKSYQAAFALAYLLGDPQKSALSISSVRMPWGGGKVGASGITVPLRGKQPIKLTLKVDRVPIESLMKTLTGDAAKATGVVSGSLPVTVSPQGKIRVGKGSLASEEEGVIVLSPEAIPGDNVQVGLVRDVLKNLHYSLLSLTLDMAPDDTLVVALAVEGKNPDVQGGRPIKLNVNLSGDLLNSLLQNMKLMTDPTQFIEQNAHEKTSD